MLGRLVHMRSVAGFAGAISLALACSSEDSGDGAGGAAGSSPDVHCVSESQGCTCTADPDHTSDDSTSAQQCTPPASRNTWCCRTQDYPNTGSCECKVVGCKQEGENCSCGTMHANGPLDSCDGIAHYCCLSPAGDCSCTPTDTGCSGGKAVANCNVFRATECGEGTATTPICKGDPAGGGTGGFPGTGGKGGTGGVPGAGGFGGSGTGAATGTGGIGNAKCSSCSTAKCAPESAACSASVECTALIACMDSCVTADIPCVQACVSNHSAGAQVFQDLAACLNVKCKIECGL